MISNGTFPLQLLFVRADAETFISVISRGRIIGKLRIAIREKLFEAREAIAAIIVRIEDKPRLPSTRAETNNTGFTIILPINNIKTASARTDNMPISIRL